MDIMDSEIVNFHNKIEWVLTAYDQIISMNDMEICDWLKDLDLISMN